MALLAGGCVSPTTGARQQERTIARELQQLTLPIAPRAETLALEPGVRARLSGGVVDIDDVSVWATVSDTARAERDDEAPTPAWTRVRGLRLVAAGSAPSNPALATAFTTAARGARAGRAAAGQEPSERYTLFAAADARYAEVVEVMYNAARGELSPPRVAVRTKGGELGALPVWIQRYCAIPADEPRVYTLHGASCYAPRVSVLEDIVAVRGRATVPAGECLYVHTARERPLPPGFMRDGGALGEARGDGEFGRGGLGLVRAGLLASRRAASEDADDEDADDEDVEDADDEDVEEDADDLDDGDANAPESRSDADAPPRPAPPSEPCRALELAALERDAELLRAAIEALAEGDEPCPQATLDASDATRWQAVITTFDALRSLGYTHVSLAAGAPPEPCGEER
ncbi:MAG: hypothetical protein H6713_36580 [Myxococcales bacterium]|nr:hypothetical protein [Myxococcales bacterium]